MMGWTFTQGAERADIIARQVRSWNNDTHAGRIVRHCLKGNVLWTVQELTDKQAGTVKRFIGCDLLERERGYGWGYKDLCESMHPYYYTCPLAYLNMVPVACEEWRVGVREYQAHRRRPLRIGATYELIGKSIPRITIASIRPLRGHFNGCLYRLSKTSIGDELVAAERSAV